MDNRQMKIAIQKALDEFGMPHHIKGRSYLESAIEKCIADKTKLRNIVKVLYAEIAEENHDTVSRAERVMRHAIEISWLRGNIDAIQNTFRYTVDGRKGRPTNKEFIAYMCDFISMHGEEIADGTYSFEN